MDLKWQRRHPGERGKEWPKQRPGGETKAGWNGGGSRGLFGNICLDDCGSLLEEEMESESWERGLPEDLGQR